MKAQIHTGRAIQQIILQRQYCNGFGQRVARQQLCKHGPTRNIEEAVFSVDPTDTPIDWLNREHVICLLYVRFRSAAI
jgi:hypothetical protein